MNQMWQPDRDWQLCPHCGGDQAEGMNVAIDTDKDNRPFARQFMMCPTCDRGWDETYQARYRTTYTD